MFDLQNQRQDMDGLHSESLGQFCVITKQPPKTKRRDNLLDRGVDVG